MKRTIAFAMLAAVLAQAADVAQELYQKALVKERAAGNLEEAIALYQRAAKESAGDRSLAAKALLAAGRCYEKLGKDGATKVYQEVARNFGDLREAATAKERLAALSGAAKPADGSRMVASQIPIPPARENFHTNGIHLLYEDPVSRALMLADLNGANKRTVFTPGQLSIGGYTLSPSGKLIALKLADRVENREGFYVINADGSGLREVYRCARRGTQTVRSWAPDNSRFLATLDEEDGRMLISVPAAGGAPRKLAKLGPRDPAIGSKYSPDGRYVVYTRRDQPLGQSVNQEVYIVPAEGGDSVKLVSHPSNDRSLCWTPDGSHVLFNSQRSGEHAIYSIAVAGGQPKGEATLVTKSAGEIVWGEMSKDGVFYHVRGELRPDMFAVRVDPRTGALQSVPEPISERTTEARFSAAWSRDGRFLAYFSTAAGEQPSPATLSSLLTIRDESSARVRQFGVRLQRPDLTWAADGSAVYVWNGPGIPSHVTVDQGQPVQVESVSIATGERRVIATFPPQREISDVRPGADGASVLIEFADRPLPRRSGVLRLDLATGAVAEVIVMEATMLTLSPDGLRVAVMERRSAGQFSVSVKPVAGGEWKEISRVAAAPGRTLPVDLRWMPDGSALRYVMEELTDSYLMRIPVAGGPPEKIGTFRGMEHVHRFRMHPDGDRALFQSPVSYRELWTLRNFLPPRNGK